MQHKVSALTNCIIIISAVIAVHGQSNDSLTLSRAVDMAIKSNASLNALQKGVAAARARTGQARSAYYPLVSGTGMYSNLWPVVKIAFGPSTFQLYPANNWDVHVGADYVLYDFGKRKRSMELSAIGEQGAETRADFSAKAVTYQAIVMFETLINSDQMISAKNEDIENLRHHLDFVRKKLSTGSVTRFDVLRSEVQLSNSQTEAINLANGREKLQIDFRQFLGMAEAAPVFLKGVFDSSSQEYSADSLAKTALKQRTEIDLGNVALKALEAQRALVKLDLLPVVSAHASAGEKNGYVPDLYEAKFNTIIGGQIQIPIIDGRKSRYRAIELEARIDSMKIVLKDLTDHIRTDVLKAIADVKSANQNLNAAKVNVALAGESRRIANLQYEAGVIPNLDLLDAEDKFIQAKFAQLTSEYRYTLSRYALMQVCGFDFTKFSDAPGK
jgi:outer membrane protein